jgi:hypothetical protein
MDALEKRILKEINATIRDGGDGSFLMVSSGEYFIQIQIARDKTVLYLIAVSNAHLPPDYQITEEKAQQILDLGLNEDPDTHNYLGQFSSKPDDLNKLAEIGAGVMKIYEVNPNKIEFDIEE